MSALNASGSFPFEAVVLVADPLNDTTPDAQTHLRRDLEKTPDYVLAEISGAVARLGLRLHHYKMPSELAAAAHRHQREVTSRVVV